MSSDGLTTFKAKNKFGQGRMNGSKNKDQLALQQMGMERAQSLLAAHIKSAEEGNETAREFLLDRLFPKIKSGRFVQIEIPEVKDINDILPAHQAVRGKMCDGTITLEEGEKLFSTLDITQKAIETTTISTMIQEINERMKKAGI